MDRRSKLPLVYLPSFAVTALLLSYVGYADEMNAILRQLSRLTRTYNIKHKPILDGFLVPWKHPEIEDGLSFGWTETEFDAEWPQPKDIEFWPSYRRMKFVALSYR